MIAELTSERIAEWRDEASFEKRVFADTNSDAERIVALCDALTSERASNRWCRVLIGNALEGREEHIRKLTGGNAPEDVQDEIDAALLLHRDLTAARADLAQSRAELSEMTQAVGLATTCVPDMVIDADDPIGMMQLVCANFALAVKERDSARARLGEVEKALASARGALDEYGGHRVGCNSQESDPQKDQSCDCGWAALAPKGQL